MIGEKLSHYLITSKLGEGGMGEVYRAHDERLDRDVAIKVLPEAVSENPDRLARFEREAKLLASLSHQNIATLYGFESFEIGGEDVGAGDETPPYERSGPVHCLIMELADGETLAERIKKGPIPVDDALPIAVQIAEGLEAAHEQGIIHRDLKPANVMLSPEGKVKILDFGLAKAWDPTTPDGDVAESPTLTAQMTAAGVLLGTAAYMSPEQARGKPVDKRADIWAFGCVLWEMLTGERLFAGETVSDVLAGVLRQEPAWDALPVSIPVAARRLLLRCVDKDPRQRLHDIADARIEIEALGAPENLLTGPAPLTENAAAWRHVLPWCVAAVAVLVAVGTQLLDRAPPTERAPRPVRRTEVALPDSEPVALAESAPLGVGRPSIALSPDGSRLVYVARANETTHLSMRLMDRYETVPIPGSEGAFHPFFSPDGRWVGFFTEAKLKKVAIPDGQMVTLCEALNPVGGSWSPDNWIYFAPMFGREIQRVSADGGPPESITGDGYWPRPLPNQRALLVTTGHVLAPSIEILPLDGGDARVLVERGGDARYMPTGHVVFARMGQLLAAPFDLERLEVNGPAVPVIGGVRTELRDGAQVAFSHDGTVVYVPGPPGTEVTPVWVDGKGTVEASGLPSGVYAGPRLSPEGDRLAIVSAELNPDVWIYDLIRKTPLRITFEGKHREPLWTPDGLWVIYRKRGLGIFRKRANGTGDEEKLTSEDGFPLSVAPDGENLLAVVRGQGLWSFPLGGEDRNGALVEGSTTSFPLSRLSPDGRWIALTSGESGRSEVYAEPFPPTGERWMISSDGGEEPVWSPRGDEIFYRNGNRWMAVAVQAEPRFSAGNSRLLFEGNYANSPGYSYDIHPDGRRFLLFQRGEERPSRLHVIHNWFEELKRLAPTE